MSPLTTEFKTALMDWKPQNVSFLSLPPEVRNIVYSKLLEPMSIIWLPRSFHYEQLIWPIRVFLQTHPQICQELKTELFTGQFVIRVSVSFERSDLSGPSMLLLQRLEPLNIRKLTLFGRLSHGMVLGPATSVEYDIRVRDSGGVCTIEITESPTPLHPTFRTTLILDSLKRVAARGLADPSTRGLGVMDIVAFMHVLSRYCSRPYVPRS